MKCAESNYMTTAATLCHATKSRMESTLPPTVRAISIMMIDQVSVQAVCKEKKTCIRAMFLPLPKLVNVNGHFLHG